MVRLTKDHKATVKRRLGGRQISKLFNINDFRISNFGNAKDCIRLGRSNRLKVSLVLIMGPKETALELGY